MKLTEQRKAAFLAELARHGIVARAARAASPHSARGAVQTFRDLRAGDADFGCDWDEAMEQARGVVAWITERSDCGHQRVIQLSIA